MTLSFIRILFILSSGVVGYYVGTLLNDPILGGQTGCLLGLIVIFLEQRMQRVSMSGLSSVVFGLILGVFMAKLIVAVLKLLPIDVFALSVSEIIVTLIFSYIGATMALRGKDEFNIIIPYVRFKRQSVNENVVLVDTSALIDGRIHDIYLSHFIPGRLVVPNSVLIELQKLADSGDAVKHEKGRRGLDLISQMLHDAKVEIKIHDDNYEHSESVDDRLIMLAKVMDANVCTLDYNLERVASAKGIEVLNINALAEAVSKSYHAGDAFTLALTKPGREKDQAVGYLEDGTMVVVKGAREKIGETMKVEVTSVLKTQSGLMVFAKLV